LTFIVTSIFISEPFILDEVLWASELLNNDSNSFKMKFSEEKWSGNKVALIQIDIYGNEKKFVFSPPLN